MRPTFTGVVGCSFFVHWIDFRQRDKIPNPAFEIRSEAFVYIVLDIATVFLGNFKKSV